jgi:hypothetical protein
MLRHLLQPSTPGSARPAIFDTGSWELVDPHDPHGLPAGWRGVPGPWRHAGKPMHGLYERPASDTELVGQLDGMAVLNGWRAGYWRGPATVAAWSSPLVSYWNPLLAQGDGRLSACYWVDDDDWTAEAVLTGWKPFGSLSCSRSYAREVRARATDAPFRIDVSDYGRDGISLARTASLSELYPSLPQLLQAYAAVLPFEVYQSEVASLGGIDRDSRPADFLDDGFAVLEEGPLARLGLVLGYPPLVTAGWLQRPAGIWVERGSMRPPTWQHPRIFTTANGAAR